MFPRNSTSTYHTYIRGLDGPEPGLPIASVACAVALGQQFRRNHAYVRSECGNTYLVCTWGFAQQFFAVYLWAKAMFCEVLCDAGAKKNGAFFVSKPRFVSLGLNRQHCSIRS